MRQQTWAGVCTAVLVVGPLAAQATAAAPELSSSRPAGGVTTAASVDSGTATAVTTGFEHSCVVTSAGGVSCWGHNQFGQLGDGSLAVDSPRAVPVAGLASGVVQVAAGEDHTCAVTSTARVRCWGSNTWGMLGDGSVTDARVPVDVKNLRDVRQVLPGGAHTCALQNSGRVWCWGSNLAGELGDGTTTPSTTPRAVVGLPQPATQVATGVHHSCALLQDRSVWCWGWNFYGELGTGDGRDTGVPTRILLPAVVSLRARLDATCATTTAATAYCWGRTGFYVGDRDVDLKPTRVEGISGGGTTVAPGYSATCGIISGWARCWGQSYELSGLGDGKSLAAWLPVTVRGLGAGVQSIDGNYFHQCAVTAAGTVKCWGGNMDGQLGNGSRQDSGIPVPLSWSTTPPAASSTPARPGPTPAGAGDQTPGPRPLTGRSWDQRSGSSPDPRGVVTPGGIPDATRTPSAPTTLTAQPSVATVQPQIAQLAVGDSHTCARTVFGAVYCWGSNIYGAVGVSGGGTGSTYSTPQLVAGMGYGVSWVSAGSGHTCAVQDRAVWCWGENYHHEVSPSDDSVIATPTRFTAISEPVIQVEAGYWFSCALTVSGAVKCWGTNYDGLGDGHSISSGTPVQVRGLTSGVTSLSTKQGTCAVRSGGQLWCWGFNSNGELGNGTTTASSVPVKVLDLPGRVTQATRGDATCALVQGEGPRCWGYGGSGALGNGAQADALTPVPVSGPGAGITSISAGRGTCAVTTTGTVTCWGTAAYGLGDATVYGTLVPVTLSVGPVTTVDVGSSSGCVALRAGGASCWGLNNQGQLGAGVTSYLSSIPTPVKFS